MEEYITCCKICGNDVAEEIGYCTDCGNGQVIKGTLFKSRTTLPIEDVVYTSQYPRQYYENLSIEKYGTIDKWYDVFVEIELSKQPSFSMEKYKISLPLMKERAERRKEMAEHPEKYAPKKVTINVNEPKCPTCNSTNIKKISITKRAVHGYAFGLLSKTARSQFECKNCGYKW